MDRRLIFRLAAAWLWVLVTPSGVLGAPPASLAQEFETICADLRDSEQPYYGQLTARRLEESLRAEVDGARAIELRRQLAREYLELGRVEEALALLEEAREAARRTALDAERAADLEFDLEFDLGLAHLRAAERANCVEDHLAASCILPIDASNRHRRPEHSRQAMEHFLASLRLRPRDYQAAWLANLSAWLAGADSAGIPAAYRLESPDGASGSRQTQPPEAQMLETGRPGWIDVAPILGVNAFDVAGGAVLDDMDGDGLLDLVTTTADPCGGMKAFRNDGRGGFEDVSEAWGLAEQLGGLNLLQADYDGDGRLDLLVLRGAWMGDHGRIRNSLLRNALADGALADGTVDEKAGRFVDVTYAAGLAEPALPTISAAWADYDLDGDLDLYVGNEVDDTGRAFASQLFRNRGDGSFDEVAAMAGVRNERHAKGVAWGDFDDDGDPDLYVSNIGPNRLYVNRGDGTFEDGAERLGVTRPVWRSFASWFFDFDNDGDLDLFVGDYEAKARLLAEASFGLASPLGQPLLYRNDGGRFVEIGAIAGFARPLLPMGANYGDVDNDGWLDVYLGTGDPDFATLVPNALYRNRRGGGFEDATLTSGLGHLQKGHGVAFGDVDNDGDQDLLHQLGGFYPGDAYGNALFVNPSSETESHRWVTLLVEGSEANRFGVGARIEVVVRDTVPDTEGDGLRSIHRVVGSGGSFGASSLRQEIGLGAAERIEEIVVRWPGSPGPGSEQRFPGPKLDGIYRVTRGVETLEPVALPRLRLGASRAHRAVSP